MLSIGEEWVGTELTTKLVLHLLLQGCMSRMGSFQVA
jgi:hypothetical protein